MGKKRTREVQDDPTVDKMDEDDSSSDEVSLYFSFYSPFSFPHPVCLMFYNMCCIPGMHNIGNHLIYARDIS